jgi:excisionase family DNA binding protein
MDYLPLKRSVEMTNSPQPQIEPSVQQTRPSPSFLTLREFHARLPVSLSTVRRWLKRQSIPYVQPSGKGGIYLIPEDALDRALELLTPASTTAATKRLPGPKPLWQRISMTKVMH